MTDIKLTILLSLFVCVSSWKICSDTFCNKIRQSPTGYDPYTLDTLITTNTSVEGILKSGGASTNLKFQLTAIENGIFRLYINDNTEPRYRPKEALASEFPPLPIAIKTTASVTTVTHQKNHAKIYKSPFKVEFYNGEKLVSVANAKNRLVFGTTAPDLAVALDISFPGTQRAYGIPEHADRLALRTTGKDILEPYRHFNLDYGRYQVISTEALYGTIPVLYAHGGDKSSGVFWLNSAQTWIDITNGPDQIDAFFMSETGAIEMYILTGPTLPQTVMQYAKLTGVAPLPQYFTLGYHQSRYSYMSQDEVMGVVKEFDANNLPLEVMWLDIDYTDAKKYFTWNPQGYPNPAKLLQDLAATNRKLVAIIDPHIKVDTNYFLHNEATAKHYYVREKKDGVEVDYVGDCWPGNSSYLDFLNPEAAKYYAGLYSAKAEFNNKNIHLWNDMNEPAVFNNPDHENTMSGDLLHHGGLKHRDIHNIYGFHQIKSSHKGLLDRNLKVRPFILTRAHFAGIQRFAAIWTGDNYASWQYLQISFPMCLTEALAGVSFCGADVGGFAGVPDDELFQRWYQAGAWLPFYRGHSAINVPRREPYLYPDTVQNRIKTALYQRYAHLPMWYTLFREHELHGEPVIRPITYHYPTEADALSIDDEILVGANILVAPVLEQGIHEKSVYLPGGETELWFNIDDDYKKMSGSGYQVVPISLDSVPVFYRGGSIIVRKDQERPTTFATHTDLYTLYICLDSENKAEGTLYVDDYETYMYQTAKQYFYIRFTFVNTTFSTSIIDAAGIYGGAANINQAIIVNPPTNVIGAKILDQDSGKITTEYSPNRRTLIINGISTVDIKTPFKLELIKSNSVVCKLSGFALLAMVACFVLV